MSHKMVRSLITTLMACILIAGGGVANAQIPGEEEPPPLIGKTLNVGTETFEPTIGVDAAGRIYFSVTRSDGVAIGWRPGMYKSEDGGNTWTDITPTAAGITLPPETNDPFIWVDQSTGRIFNFHMAPILACSGMMSFSDNQGASWTTTPLGCGGEEPYDHQTMVAAKPRVFPTSGYENILLQCVNSVWAETCARSLDGGLSWTPFNIAYPNGNATSLCGTQTGHLAAAPDGMIYLPTPLCGTKPAVFSSADDGLTWTQHIIFDVNIPFVDPAIAVDELGNLYASYIDEAGTLFYSVSKDQAQTWSTPVAIAEGITAHLPALDVGDPGKVVVAFPGTDNLEEGFFTPGYPSGNTDLVNSTTWDGYFAISYNALEENPTFETVKTNGDDPLVRRAACTRGNRCSYFVDFIDVTVGPDGRPYAAFVDGCTGSCVTNPNANNNEETGAGVVATLSSGPTLCELGCPYKFGGVTSSGPTRSGR